MTEMNDRGPVVIIGGGHNGLVCAAYLAKAGREVLVLESHEQVGGAAATREFAPGFKASCAHFNYLLDDSISTELDLAGNGLQMAAEGLDTIALSADGSPLALSSDGLTGDGISPQDHQAYAEYRRFMSKFAAVIGRLHNQVPPRIRKHRDDLLTLAKIAFDVRRLGRDDMREFLRIAGINLYDVLAERFDNPQLKGALCMDGVLGAFSGPRSNNTVFAALHRMSGNNPGSAGTISVPVGGMGAITQALASAAVKAGADVRISSPVRRILMDGMQVSGVELQDGEQLAASTVISNLDIRTTMMGLLGARHLEAGFARRAELVRSTGHAAKLHLALDALPGFKGLSRKQLGQRLLIAPSPDYVERAFNHCKYGEFSTQPVFEISIPTVHDTSLAPDGKHVLSAVVQYAPRELKAGWDGGKQKFTELVMSTLEEYAPGIGEQVLATELLTPEDMEKEFGNHGGHWHHAELSLHQFLMLRPVPKSAQYRTPVDGLYLCGAGCHPGGGVMGSAGRNAANALLAAEGGKS